MTHEQAHVLVVDDIDVNREMLARILKRQKCQVSQVADGLEALEILKTVTPDLILLDVSMPNMDGYEVCEQIKANPSTQHIPVIFISALNELEDKMRAFQVGGVDYITKPFKVEEVSARVNSQLTMAQQRQKIMQLNETQAQILQMVSHDLKNPLQIIIGYASMLLEPNPPIDYIQDIAEQILNSANKMDQLVRQLLDLRHLESGTPLHIEPVSLSKVLLSVGMMNELALQQKGQNFTLDLPPDDLLMIEADALLIEQVFTNLLSNAIKYTPVGGEIAIRTSSDESSVTVIVEDNGLGIPPKALPRLFDRFYRVDTQEHRQAASGTGLGLSIVRAIVENHHGDISVESELGKGSRFIVTLPRTQGEHING